MQSIAFRQNVFRRTLQLTSTRLYTAAANDSLHARLKADQKTYMRGRTQPDLTVVKSILSDLIYLNKSPTPPATPDEGILTILQRSIKKRQESISQYQSAGRQDLVDQENKELEVLNRYMPAQMSDEEIRDEIQQIVQNIGAASIKDLGKVMKAWAIDSSKADKKKVSDMVKAVLDAK
ncbi:hypothetical protein INT44_004582 [Umbelopsis vinacea]|uniref:Altered inheritance of mitochondria protein 41 n=1 Tax=Umbelopsis vinacea TaxID=44442 RepID=A0A8H7UN89_9FUNG|nr:hypothetical protein INT44_004582 [Umbelopsis vinacea]